VVDLFPKKNLLLLCDFCLALVTVGLYCSTGLESPQSLGIVYVLLFVHGTLGIVQFPCLAAVTADMVPPAGLPRANGLLSMAESSANLLGPLLAGFFVVTFPLRSILLIDGGTFVVSFALIAVTAVQNTRASADSGGLSLVGLLSKSYEGLTLLWTNRA